MGLVIDTSALVAVERSSNTWDEVLSPAAEEPVVLPAIVYAELLVGVRLADTPMRFNRNVWVQTHFSRSI